MVIFHVFIFGYLSSGVLCGWGSSLISSLGSKVEPEPPALEDAYLNIDELTKKYGYPFENHTVTTKDDYVLNLHRIPHGKNGERNGNVVFLMHGLCDASDGWILQGPNVSLGYLLADEGYDVWMGNARGNMHSEHHKSLNTKMPEFWMFSWDEIALDDLPAMIDYTLNATNRTSLHYIGFSQGTTTLFALLSAKPEYNSKIKMMIGMAPEVFMGHATSPMLRLLSPAQEYLQSLLTFFNIHSSSEAFFSTVGPLLCNVIFGCDSVFYSVLGPNNVKKNMWPIILGHSPSGGSTSQFIQYGQQHLSKRFSRFDYGKVVNIQKYGQENPPEYNLKNVQVPIVLFYGGNDWFSDLEDAEALIKILPTVETGYFIKEFGHVDHLYAEEARTLIYPQILRHLKEEIAGRYIPPRFRFNKIITIAYPMSNSSLRL